MEAAIKKIVGDSLKSDVKQLCLDTCKETTISGLDSDFTSLTNLSLVGNKITSLEGLPHLPSLTRLDVTDNLLNGDGFEALKGLPALKDLLMAGNKIATIECLKPLAELKNLKILDLEVCPVTNVEDYRKKVFELLPGLTVLDILDKEGNEVEPDIPDDEEETEEDEEESEEEEEEETTGKRADLGCLMGEDLSDDEGDFEPVEGEDEDEDIPEEFESMMEEPNATNCETNGATEKDNGTNGTNGTNGIHETKKRSSDVMGNGDSAKKAKADA